MSRRVLTWLLASLTLAVQRKGDHMSFDAASIVFGPERTDCGRRARMTGEPRWLAKQLLGRSGLGLDPVTLEQARFQALIAWSFWGLSSCPGDPGGNASRALSYSFDYSQGRDFWPSMRIRNRSVNEDGYRRSSFKSVSRRLVRIGGLRVHRPGATPALDGQRASRWLSSRLGPV